MQLASTRQITALRFQKRGQRRVNVYLDGDYAFALQAVLAAPLRVGQTLSSEAICELQKRDAAENAYEKALAYLSYRPRSRAEVVTYLEGRKVETEVANMVVDRLAKAGLLDDEAFAQFWVENREQFRPRGTRALRWELQRKGVPPAAIERALQTIDETESAYRAGHERARRLGQLDRQTFRQKLGGFLQRRGFAYDVVSDAVERLWREAERADIGDAA
jgi:regulatory protein